MKKNISINISGIIFHVEEDGYDLLKSYLESIGRYFSNYEDCQEIVSDIESRIAEIFLSKISPAKQIITREDVETVMATMGSVKDFAAAEGVLEDEPAYAHGYQQEQSYQDKTYEEQAYRETTHSEGHKKLYRDAHRKILGGVAAGIAQYFRMDPLWIRLLIVALLFVDVFASLGTITIVVYIVLWIVLPPSYDLPEDEKVKKLYRNPDDKVISGVSSGIAAYFGIDATVVRLLFVLSVLLFGTGALVYVILWIITPQAFTLTEKMRMKGEPVTLSNIESSIKKNFNVSEDGEETTLVKVLLFPFRLIAVVLNNLGRVLLPLLVFLAEAARILAGLLLFLLGIAIVFTLLVTGGVLLGIYSADTADIMTNLPLEVIRAGFPDWGIAFAYFTLIIPALALLLAGIAVMARRRIVNAPVAWTALGLWFVCLGGLSVTLVPFIMDFQDNGQYTTTDTYRTEGTAVLTLAGYTDREEEFTHPMLVLRGHDSSEFVLKKEFEANGRNRRQALENAQMVDYEISVDDSVFSFPAAYTFQDDAMFRMQRVNLVLYIPYEHPFMMDRNLAPILRHTLDRNGYSMSDMQDQVFAFTRTGLECRTCGERKNMDDAFDQRAASPASSPSPGSYSQTADVGSFEAVDISGPFQVNITRGPSFQVSLQGTEEAVAHIDVRVAGETLTVDYDPQALSRSGGVTGITIVTPLLSKAAFGGATQASIRGFEGTDIEVDLSGSSRTLIEADVAALSARLSGASGLKLSGQARAAEVAMEDASRLDGYDFEIKDMNLTLAGASRARVAVSRKLQADIIGAGRVTYRGNPEVNINASARQQVEKAN